MSDSVLTSLITSIGTLLGVIIVQLVTAASNRQKLKIDMIAEQDKTKTDIDTKLTCIEKKLDNHIKGDEEHQAIQSRVRILEFSDSLYNDMSRWPSEGMFLQIAIDCDAYESYTEKHDLPNGIATNAIENIKEKYQFCLDNKAFGQKKFDS